MSEFYPIYLNVKGKKCVIIGGGKVAYRKVCSLREAGADTVVVSPEFCPEIADEGGLTLVKENYDERFYLLYYCNRRLPARPDESVRTGPNRYRRVAGGSPHPMGVYEFLASYSALKCDYSLNQAARQSNVILAGDGCGFM